MEAIAWKGSDPVIFRQVACPDVADRLLYREEKGKRFYSYLDTEMKVKLQGIIDILEEYGTQ